MKTVVDHQSKQLAADYWGMNMLKGVPAELLCVLKPTHKAPVLVCFI